MSVLLESSVLHRPSAADPSMEQRHNCIPAWGFLVDVILLSVHLTVTSFAGFKINSSPADLALLSFFFFLMVVSFVLDLPRWQILLAPDVKRQRVALVFLGTIYSHCTLFNII